MSIIHSQNVARIRDNFFSSRDEMFASLKNRCISTLKDALASNDEASLLVSGGSTPEPLYTGLSETDLEWSRIKIALVDERWVDIDHPASNTAFVYQSLKIGQAKSASFVPMKNSAATAQQGCDETNKAYSSLSTPFDLLILGMGPDGHFASLFPNSKGLGDALDQDNKNLCCAIQAIESEVTGKNTERMSLTLNGILQAEKIVLLITGEEKLNVYKLGLKNSDYAQIPVSAILQQTIRPVDVYWAP